MEKGLGHPFITLNSSHFFSKLISNNISLMISFQLNLRFLIEKLLEIGFVDERRTTGRVNPCLIFYFLVKCQPMF